jgi:hypothetical protein
LEALSFNHMILGSSPRAITNKINGLTASAL